MRRMTIKARDNIMLLVRYKSVLEHEKLDNVYDQEVPTHVTIRATTTLYYRTRALYVTL